MKVLKIIGIVLLAIVIIIGALILFAPSTSHLERQITINAPVEDVFAEVNSFRTFDKYSAWSEIDTTAEITLSGPMAGVGAKYSWASDNENLGNGSIEITSSTPNESIKSAMGFEGYPGKPTAGWALEADGDNTKVTYMYDEEGISGIWKVFALMIDGQLGPMYEKTLQKLKARVESKPSFNVEIGVEEVNSITFLAIDTSTPNNPDEIGKTMTDAYGKLSAYMVRNKVEAVGAPLAVYTNYTEESIDMICGIPVPEGTEADADGVYVTQSQEGSVVKAVHMGDYMELESTHELIQQYMNYYAWDWSGPPWEDYPTDPTVVTDTAQWVTNVYYPVR